MHRHVVRHLPRQRQHGVLLASIYPHNHHRDRPYSTSKDNPSTTQPASGPLEPEDFAANLPSPETLRAVLSTLNHTTLLDTHRKLNAFATNLTSLPKSLPRHAPATLRAPAGETAPYVLGHTRYLLSEIERKVGKVVDRVEHTRAHVGDLLEEAYTSSLPPLSTSTSASEGEAESERNGTEANGRHSDALRAWRHHVSRLGAGAKAEELTELRYQEEADVARMRGSAGANLRRVREFRARVAEEGRKRAWDGKGEGRVELAQSGAGARENDGGVRDGETAKKGKGETGKETKEGDMSLLELQERLQSGMS